MNRVKIWGHRGASGYAPENTLPAFVLAAEQGADGVELDVQMTKDDQLVVIHDEWLDRVSNGTGYVREYTLEELKKLNFNKLHPEYEHVQIPTLEEVYRALKPLGLTINAELKTSYYWYPGIEEAVLKLADEMDMNEQVIYSSFNHLSIAKILKLNPNAHTGILFSDVIYDTVNYANGIGTEALHPGVWHLKMSDLMDQWVNSNQKVHVWTVNEEADMKCFMENHVDAIITNFPDKAVAVRKALEEAHV